MEKTSGLIIIDLTKPVSLTTSTMFETGTVSTRTTWNDQGPLMASGTNDRTKLPVVMPTTEHVTDTPKEIKDQDQLLGSRTSTGTKSPGISESPTVEHVTDTPKQNKDPTLQTEQPSKEVDYYPRPNDPSVSTIIIIGSSCLGCAILILLIIVVKKKWYYRVSPRNRGQTSIENRMHHKTTHNMLEENNAMMADLYKAVSSTTTTTRSSSSATLDDDTNVGMEEVEQQ